MSTPKQLPAAIEIFRPGVLIDDAGVERTFTADDIQAIFKTELDQSTPSKNNELGVKGVGELGTIGAPPWLLGIGPEDFAFPQRRHVHDRGLFAAGAPFVDQGRGAERGRQEHPVDGAELGALKPAENSRGLIARLVERNGRQSPALLKIAGLAAIRVDLGPYEIKTLRIRRDGSWSECDLLERPLKK